MLVGLNQQRQETIFTFLLTRTFRKANLPHKTIENRHGLSVSWQFLLFFVDLPPASDRVTVILVSRLRSLRKATANNKKFENHRNTSLNFYVREWPEDFFYPNALTSPRCEKL